MNFVKLMILAACMFALAGATDATKKLHSKELQNNVWEMVNADTVGRTTGNLLTIYRDTSGNRGFDADDLKGDTIAVDLYGYGDADTCYAQVKIQESPNSGTTWVTTQTDTLSCLSTTTELKTVKSYKRPVCEYKITVEAYGTTDSVNLVRARIRGE